MKKIRFLSFFLSIALSFSLAAGSAVPAYASSSDEDSSAIAGHHEEAASSAVNTETAEDTTESDTDGSAETAKSAASSAASSTASAAASSSDGSTYVVDARQSATTDEEGRSYLGFAAATDDSFEPIDGAAALLVDENTETILYSQDIDKRCDTASLVKIMTTLLVIEAVERGELTYDQRVTIDEFAKVDLPTAAVTAKLKQGEVLTLDNLLYFIMVGSANDACNEVAILVAGSISGFVEMMNQRAEELGCENTHFTNPTGLHDDNQYSSCYDLYLITREAWQYDKFQELSGADEIILEPTNLSDERHYLSTNLLLGEKKALGYKYTYALGVKAGTNEEGGICVVGTAEYKGRLLYAVVLDSYNEKAEDGTTTQTAFVEMRRLFRHGYNDFTALTITTTDELITQVPVTLGKDVDYVLLSPQNDVSVDLVGGISSKDFERVLHVPDSVEAPVYTGDSIGSMDLLFNGTVYASVNLVAVNDVDLSVPAQVGNLFVSFFQSIPMRIIIVLLVLALIGFIILVIWTFTIRRKKRSDDQ